MTSLLVLVGCATSPSTSGPGSSYAEKEYANVELVARDADATVYGTLGDVLQTAMDDGGVPQGPKFPVSMYEFDIKESRPAAITKMNLVLPMAEGDSGESSLAGLRPGSTVVLMVTRFRPGKDSSLADWARGLRAIAGRGIQR